MKLAKKNSKKKTKKRKLRPNHNRTPKSAQQKAMTLALRAFPTELVWKMRVKSAALQMTMKEFVIQEMTKATADNQAPKESPQPVDAPPKMRKKVTSGK